MSDDERLMQWGVVRSEVGRTHVMGFCPFCGATVCGYLWSIAGSGKRCECGALLRMDKARPPRPRP